MSDASPSRDKPSPSGETAIQAFFNLVSRELEAAGNEDSIPFLPEILKLRVDEQSPKGLDAAVKMTLSQKLTSYSLRLNASTEEVISWYIEFLADNGSDETSPEDALKIAEQTAKPPKDAVLSTAEYDSSSGRTIFRARWSHALDDLPIEGDFIEVLVNGAAKRAFSYTRNWRTPDLSDSAREI